MANDRRITQARFGRAVKKLREARGLSQEGLAEQVGIGRNTVSLIENAKMACSLPLAAEIAGFFGTTLDAMLGDVGGAATPAQLRLAELVQVLPKDLAERAAALLETAFQDKLPPGSRRYPERKRPPKRS